MVTYDRAALGGEQIVCLCSRHVIGQVGGATTHEIGRSTVTQTCDKGQAEST